MYVLSDIKPRKRGTHYHQTNPFAYTMIKNILYFPEDSEDVRFNSLYSACYLCFKFKANKLKMKQPLFLYADRLISKKLLTLVLSP